MRNLAKWLAFFFVATQIDRVAHFIHLYQPSDSTLYRFLSYGISIGLALGTFLSFYFLRQSKVRWAAIAGILLFGGFDLFFNEFALIRTVSEKALVSADSSFVWIPASVLQDANQIVALGYGLLPTLASAVLGWIQGGVDKLTDAELKPTVWIRLSRSFFKMFDKFSGGIALAFEARAEGMRSVAMNTRGNQEVVDGVLVGTVTKKRWSALSKEDVAFISGNNRKAIMAKFAVSDGTAGNWKSWVADGVLPWEDAKPALKVPKDAEG